MPDPDPVPVVPSSSRLARMQARERAEAEARAEARERRRLERARELELMEQREELDEFDLALETPLPPSDPEQEEEDEDDIVVPTRQRDRVRMVQSGFWSSGKRERRTRYSTEGVPPLPVLVPGQVQRQEETPPDTPSATGTDTSASTVPAEETQDQEHDQEGEDIIVPQRARDRVRLVQSGFWSSGKRERRDRGKRKADDVVPPLPGSVLLSEGPPVASTSADAAAVDITSTSASTPEPQPEQPAAGPSMSTSQNQNQNGDRPEEPANHRAARRDMLSRQKSGFWSSGYRERRTRRATDADADAQEPPLPNAGPVETAQGTTGMGRGMGPMRASTVSARGVLAASSTSGAVVRPALTASVSANSSISSVSAVSAERVARSPPPPLSGGSVSSLSSITARSNGSISSITSASAGNVNVSVNTDGILPAVAAALGTLGNEREIPRDRAPLAPVLPPIPSTVSSPGAPTLPHPLRENVRTPAVRDSLPNDFRLRLDGFGEPTSTTANVHGHVDRTAAAAAVRATVLPPRLDFDTSPRAEWRVNTVLLPPMLPPCSSGRHARPRCRYH
ncbi:hypothetical protein BKA62DRAFT_37489 [Auriculariales sp. MPI-PUGE-AT-0066]|nr:hypothetical protein BKA62DRAFT_37489 [Auriculariales sp. MPI-PUGE-AT-0066]